MTLKDLVEFLVTKELLAQAEADASRMPVMNNSILEGEGRLISQIGEVITDKYFRDEGFPLERVSNVDPPSFDYDFICGNIKIDVKSQFLRGRPNLGYETLIPNISKNQNCDFYIFCRVTYESDRAWIVGCFPKTKYFEEAKFRREGELWDSKFTKVKKDCWTLMWSDLYPIQDLVEGLKEALT